MLFFIICLLLIGKDRWRGDMAGGTGVGMSIELLGEGLLLLVLVNS